MRFLPWIAGLGLAILIGCGGGGSNAGVTTGGLSTGSTGGVTAGTTAGTTSGTTGATTGGETTGSTNGGTTGATTGGTTGATTGTTTAGGTGGAVDPSTPILFSSDQSGVRQIYRVNFDGSNLTQLTFGVVSTGEARFSPDNSQIVFSRNAVIHVMNADGSSQQSLGVEGTTPVWTPDGTRIVFYRDSDLFIMNANGSGVTQLSAGLDNEFAPRVSRDGTKIYFVLYEGGPYSLMRMNLDGSGVEKIIDLVETADTPVESPDGEWIYFASQGRIQRVRPNGADQQFVGPASVQAFTLDISSDGSTLVFSHGAAPNFGIFTANIDGSNMQTLVPATSANVRPDFPN